MTKVINLFGGPGAGKSTTAAGLFYEMKVRDIKCELVTEYAKDMTYEKQREFNKTLYCIMKEVSNSNSREFLERMDHVKKISEGK